MSDVLGPVALEQPPQSVFLELPATGVKEYSEETARTIDAEIRKLLDAAQERVRSTLTSRREALHALAGLLMEKEVVDRDLLTQVLAGPAGEVPNRTPADRVKRTEITATIGA